MDLESTITLVGFAGFAVALFGYLGAMKRDLRAELAVWGAQLDAKIDAGESRAQTRFDTVDARFESLESRFDARFQSLESRFESLEPRFESIDARFDALDTRVGDLRDDMRAGFAENATRLAALEQRTYDLGRRRRPDAG